jgi:hypothetical protein
VLFVLAVELMANSSDANAKILDFMLRLASHEKWFRSETTAR